MCPLLAEQAVDHTIKLPVIWGTVTNMRGHCKDIVPFWDQHLEEWLCCQVLNHVLVNYSIWEGYYNADGYRKLCVPKQILWTWIGNVTQKHSLHCNYLCIPLTTITEDTYDRHVSKPCVCDYIPNISIWYNYLTMFNTYPDIHLFVLNRHRSIVATQLKSSIYISVLSSSIIS